MGKFLYGLVVLFAAVFLVLLLFFRITDGSFAEAGARMDRLLGAAAEETGEATKEMAREADEAARDLTDGD
ncbi:MAG: hypothetical protein RIB03_05145 [Henriciella sp.]|uniref:hypothetical protein n=1 Tax=Henriciella sp. TaxID=1968823 RepID=UPI0026182A67|nr:hypothetical protein [Henriciella sp.]